MNSSMTNCIQMYGLSAHLFERALEKLADNELYAAPGDDSNPMLWIAAHAAHSRAGIVRMVGGTRDLPWNELFARGQKRPKNKSEYPSLAEVLLEWGAATGEMAVRMEGLTEAELNAPSPFQVPGPDQTLRGALYFLAYHEACHVGQMMYLRKWMGKGGLVG